jgi:hypothetical protein
VRVVDFSISNISFTVDVVERRNQFEKEERE